MLPGWNQLFWWRLRRRLNDLQLLLLDVDGALTDEQLIKLFDVRDGLGIPLSRQVAVLILFSVLFVRAPLMCGPANWVSSTAWWA